MRVKGDTSNIFDVFDISRLFFFILFFAENPLGPPEVDPQKDLKINSLDFADHLKSKEFYYEKMCQSKCMTCPKLDEHVRKDSKMRTQLIEVNS